MGKPCQTELWGPHAGGGARWAVSQWLQDALSTNREAEHPPASLVHVTLIALWLKVCFSLCSIEVLQKLLEVLLNSNIHIVVGLEASNTYTKAMQKLSKSPPCGILCQDLQCLWFSHWKQFTSARHSHGRKVHFLKKENALTAPGTYIPRHKSDLGGIKYLKLTSFTDNKVEGTACIWPCIWENCVGRKVSAITPPVFLVWIWSLEPGEDFPDLVKQETLTWKVNSLHVNERRQRNGETKKTLGVSYWQHSQLHNSFHWLPVGHTPLPKPTFPQPTSLTGDIKTHLHNNCLRSLLYEVSTMTYKLQKKLSLFLCLLFEEHQPWT